MGSWVGPAVMSNRRAGGDSGTGPRTNRSGKSRAMPGGHGMTWPRARHTQHNASPAVVPGGRVVGTGEHRQATGTSMAKSKKKLGDILVAMGKLTPDQVQTALGMAK